MVINFFVRRPIRIENERHVHKKFFHRALIATTIYAILYGIYEYFIVYHTIGLVTNNIITSGTNWLIMCSGVVILLTILTQFRFKYIIFGLLFMLTLEDFTFWMCQWVDTGIYPFPAGTWWDNHFASFRALGGISWPLPFWPYIPFFFIPTSIIISLFYLSCSISPKTSQIYSWIVGPLWSALVVSLIVEESHILIFTEATALLIIFLFSIFSYIYLTTLLVISKFGNETSRE